MIAIVKNYKELFSSKKSREPNIIFDITSKPKPKSKLFFFPIFCIIEELKGMQTIIPTSSEAIT